MTRPLMARLNLFWLRDLSRAGICHPFQDTLQGSAQNVAFEIEPAVMTGPASDGNAARWQPPGGPDQAI